MQNQTYQYWLLDWLEANSIKNRRDATKFLSNPHNLTRMRDLAEDWWETTKVGVAFGINLVAGAGLNLADSISCPSLICRKKQVDILFRHAWHYFDKIYLPDAIGADLLSANIAQFEFSALDKLLNDISVVLYLRQIGALELITYYPRKKVSPTEHKHSPPKIESQGFQKTRMDIINEIVEIADYACNKMKEHFILQFKDPLTGLETSIELNKKEVDDLNGDENVEINEKKAKVLLASKFVDDCFQYLLDDLNAAKAIGGTMGSSIWTQSRLVGQLSSHDNPKNSVAFHLPLPSISNIPIRKLIKLRSHEKDAFLRFRDALVRGVREYFSHVSSNSKFDTIDVAESIKNDVIEPELRRLGDKLRAAKRTVARKTLASVTFGTIATTCGLALEATPLIACSAGIGTMLSGAGGAVSKYLDDKKDVELSDMYFLWKALSHGKH